MKRLSLGLILLGVTVTMSIAEFIEVQKLSSDELRTRFGLERACDPTLTAVNTEPTANRVTVAIECRVKPPEAPPPRSGEGPGQRRPAERKP